LDRLIRLEIPENEFLEYFGPEYKLHFPVNNMSNQNTKDYMDLILNQLLDNLKQINTTGVNLSNYKDGNGEKFDFDEMTRINHDRMEEELIDSHFAKNTMNDVL